VEGRRGTWENGWGLRLMGDGQRLGKLSKLYHVFSTLALTRISGPLGDTRASGTMLLLITRFSSPDRRVLKQ
jgi:hypothetical protein